MSMYTITGTLLTVLDDYVIDQDSGEKIKKPRIQLMGDMPVKDTGQFRKELVTLTVQNLSQYKDLVGQTLRLPFGMFSPQKGVVIQFVPKGASPQVLGKGGASAA